MVDKAIREERHRKNQEALIISASGGSKAKPSAPGVQHKGDAYPRDDYKKGKSRGDSPVESDAQKGKKGSKGKGKGKGKTKQSLESSSGSTLIPRADPGSVAKREPYAPEILRRTRFVASTTCGEFVYITIANTNTRNSFIRMHESGSMYTSSRSLTCGDPRRERDPMGGNQR